MKLTAYPIGTKVILKYSLLEGEITGVAFYHNYIKYLVANYSDNKFNEEWMTEYYFTIGDVSKIGFSFYDN